MGTVFKKTVTRPLPKGAELFTKQDQQFAKWKPVKGRARTAKVTTGKDGSTRILDEAGTYTAKFRDGEGILCEVSTGCRDEDAARSILSKLERQAELVKSEVISPAEAATADHQRTAIAEAELVTLLHVARLRPLAEYGRKTSHPDDDKAEANGNPPKRSSWTKAVLTLDTMQSVAERAKERLTDNPEFVEKLERLGRERALIYKTLVLTGLRRGDHDVAANLRRVDSAGATGKSFVAPPVAPNSGKLRQSVSFAVISSNAADERTTRPATLANRMKPSKKALPAVFAGKAFEVEDNGVEPMTSCMPCTTGVEQEQRKIQT